MSNSATILSLVAQLKLAKGEINGKTVVMPTGLCLTPTVILQHEAGDHAPLGIYRLDRLLAGKIAVLDQQMISYLEKSAYYADLILGADWRSRNGR